MKHSGKVALAVVGATGIAGCQPTPARYQLGEVTMIEHLQPGGYSAFTGSPASRAEPVLPPEGEEICRIFGLGDQHRDRCSERVVLALAQKQTDPKLWFVNSAAGPGSESSCPGGRPFERVTTNAGTNVVRYLCLSPKSDDIITDAELKSFVVLAKRLNDVPHPTLAEFRQALYLKIIINSYARIVEESPK